VARCKCRAARIKAAKDASREPFGPHCKAILSDIRHLSLISPALLRCGGRIFWALRIKFRQHRIASTRPDRSGWSGVLAVKTIARIRHEHFVKGEVYWHRRFADRRAASGSLAAKAGKRPASYLSAFEGKPLKIQDVPGKLTDSWRATADEDGHYCFAVAL
jgi:hypothetical protein